MAEAIAGLALASSIITLVDITGKLVKMGWGCFRALKSPPKELADVMSELMSLQGVLCTLRVATCNAVLLDVLAILEGLGKRRFASAIAAATSGQKLLTAKIRIERMKVLLTLALSSDNLSLSHVIKDYLHQAVEQLQDGQEVIHSELLRIDSHISKISRASDDMTVGQKEKHQSDRYHKTLGWLSKLDFEANHFNACRLQQPGTGTWLVEGKKFMDWAEEEHSTFWLYAYAAQRVPMGWVGFSDI